MEQYDKVGRKYSEMIQIDPIKKYAQRPTVLKYLGDVKDKLILDMGCGDGEIARLLSVRGARLVCYDISPEQVSLAKSKSVKFPSIQYFVSDQNSFSFPEKFDKAFAAMVLCYSNTLADLQAFFNSAFSLLKDDGELVLLDLDTRLLSYGTEVFGRTHELLPDGRTKINFVVKGASHFSAIYQGYMKEQFEECAKKSGFKRVLWKKVFVSQEGKKAMGADYWNNFAKCNYWIAGVFQK